MKKVLVAYFSADFIVTAPAGKAMNKYKFQFFHIVCFCFLSELSM